MRVNNLNTSEISYFKILDLLKKYKKVYRLVAIKNLKISEISNENVLILCTNDIMAGHNDFEIGYCSDGSIPFWENILANVDVKDLYNISGIVKVGDNMIFFECINCSKRLFVCGGGHISLPLVKIAKLLDYHVTVIDDRSEFASRERFSMADEVICDDFDRVFETYEFKPDTSFVILTRGHKDDTKCLRHVLKIPFKYAGMIGSKSKVAATMNNLLAEGFSKEELNKIHAPIGLEIGGNTPGEIAVSIAAELIQTRNEKETMTVLTDDIVKYINTRENGIIATIISKNGSAPRGVGTRMIISKKQKQLIGTIGGGAVEFAAYKYAVDLLENNQDFKINKYNCVVQEYCLNSSDAAKLGMICGGNVTVMFENI